MSIRLMTLVWDIRWPTQNHLLVMLKLADYANDEGGNVWPAVSTIADQAQCSDRTVRNVLKALRDCGLAKVIEPGGGARATVYQVNVPLLRALVGSTIEGGSDHLEVPEEVYSKLDETPATVAGVHIAPLQPATGTPANKGGTPAKALQPIHHLEPSREPLAKNSNFDFGSEAATRQRARPCFTLAPTDAPQWRAWIAHLPAEQAEAAEAAGKISVTSRWPDKPGAELLAVEPHGLSKASRRMAGDVE